MRLEVERSGGFAGRTVRWSLDVDALEPERRAEVHELLEQAPHWGGSSGPDHFSYHLSLAGDPAGPGHPAGPGAAAGAGDAVGWSAGGARPGAGGPLDVRFAEPLAEPARRLLEVVRDASAGSV